MINPNETTHNPRGRTLTQFSVAVPNCPEMLRSVTQALHREGIKVTSLMTESQGDVAFLRSLLGGASDFAFVRLLTDQAPEARRVLLRSGFEVQETPVFVLEVPDRPGELDALAKRVADAGLTILWMYATAPAAGPLNVILAVDEPARAAAALEPWLEREYATTH